MMELPDGQKSFSVGLAV